MGWRSSARRHGLIPVSYVKQLHDGGSPCVVEKYQRRIRKCDNSSMPKIEPTYEPRDHNLHLISLSCCFLLTSYRIATHSGTHTQTHSRTHSHKRSKGPRTEWRHSPEGCQERSQTQARPRQAVAAVVWPRPWSRGAGPPQQADGAQQQQAPTGSRAAAACRRRGRTPPW